MIPYWIFTTAETFRRLSYGFYYYLSSAQVDSATIWMVHASSAGEWVHWNQSANRITNKKEKKKILE